MPRLSAGIVLGLLPFLILAGCKKREQQDQPEPNAYLIYEQSPYLALDGSQTQIFTFDLSRLRRLSIFDRIKTAVLDDPDRINWWSGLTRELGVDLAETVDRGVIAYHGQVDLDAPMEGAVLILVGDFSNPRQKLEGFLRFAGERYLLNPPAFTASNYAGSPVYKTRSSTYMHPERFIEFNFAFPNERIMVFSHSANLMNNSLNVIAGNAENLMQVESWRKRMDGVAIGAVCWAVGDVPASVAEKISQWNKTQPAFSGLTNLTNAERFELTFNKAGTYELNAKFICRNIESADGLTAHLELLRQKIPSLLSDFWNMDAARIQTIQTMAERAFLSTRLDASTLLLRAPSRDVERFVGDLISPSG